MIVPMIVPTKIEGRIYSNTRLSHLPQLFIREAIEVTNITGYNKTTTRSGGNTMDNSATERIPDPTPKLPLIVPVRNAPNINN